MNNIKLTIGIPVYNGERFIKKTLDSITDQLIDDEYMLEIVISDNASTDKTAEIIFSYKNNYKYLIKYFKNERNMGYDKNIDLVIQRSEGQSVWLLGCGDLLLPGVLDYIIHKLEILKYDYIQLNFNMYSEETEKFEVINNSTITNDTKFESIEEFFKKLGGPAMAVSANIVRKKCWIEIYKNRLTAQGWCHIERIINMLLNEKIQIFFISKCCFTLYRELDGWWTSSAVYTNYIQYQKILNNMRKKRVSKKIVKILYKRHYPLPLITSIILGKRTGLKFDFKLIMEVTNLFYKSVLFWLVILPLILLPNHIYKNKEFYRIYLYSRDLYTRIKLFYKKGTRI
ncbi:MAG: glycosyltransferase family 2 protein [Clostridiales bacterium]